MTDRVTKAQLRGLVDRINAAFGMPLEAWERDGSGYRSIPGVFTLDIAYGGYRLCRIVGEGGGETDITPRLPAGQAYVAMRAFLEGAYHMRDTDLSEASLIAEAV